MKIVVLGVGSIGCYVVGCLLVFDFILSVVNVFMFIGC